MPVYDDTFELNDETFDGRLLSEVEQGTGADFDPKSGSARLSWLIRKTASTDFRTCAIGGFDDGGLVKGAVQHPDYEELVGKKVSFMPYLPEQPGDGDGGEWLKATIEFGPIEHEPTDSESQQDTPEEREAWKETWDLSVESIPTEIQYGSGATANTLVRNIEFPMARISLHKPVVINWNPASVLTGYVGKINSDSPLKLPSGQTLAQYYALLGPVQCTATPKIVLRKKRVEWEVTQNYIFRPHSWNQGRKYDGTLVDLKWPGTSTDIYTAVAMQSLIDVS